MSSRTRAAEAYVKALRTGEPSATQHASQYLADDVVRAAAGQDEIAGHDNVLQRITGHWSMTSVLVHAGFSAPREENGQVTVEAEAERFGRPHRCARSLWRDENASPKGPYWREEIAVPDHRSWRPGRRALRMPRQRSNVSGDDSASARLLGGDVSAERVVALAPYRGTKTSQGWTEIVTDSWMP